MAKEEYRRGQRIISANEAAGRAERLLPLDDFGLTWGGLALPSAEATTHFCVVGATGSGKTTLLRLLMQSCLPLIGSEYKEKSYELSHPEEEPPSAQEWQDYQDAMTGRDKVTAARDAATTAHRDRLEATRKENERIQSRNAALRQEYDDLLPKISQLDKSLQALPPVPNAPIAWRVGAWATFACAIFSLPLIPLPFLFAIAFLFLIIHERKLTKKRKQLLAERERLSAERNGLDAKRASIVFLPIKPDPIPPTLPDLPSDDIRQPEARPWMRKETIPPTPYSGDGHRAMIYDAKGDMVSLLSGMGLRCPVVILNPLDARSAAWDVAKDIASPATARQFATILIPEDKNASQPFFANAARDLIGQMVLALIQIKPGEWTLRDLVLAMQNREALIGILSQTPQGKAKADIYFGEDRTGLNILSEVATRLAPFESVAEAWSRCPHKISLTDWVASESVLVLGTNEEHRAALDPINRVLFQRATELTLSQSESDTRRTWFFFDEVRDAGNLESLGRLMTKGRSKGACVVLGFQDIEGMHDAFGKERANEFIGQCANKAILRLNSPETAKWASELFGKYEFTEEESGENKGGSKTQGKTETEGETTGETTTTGSSKGTSKGQTKGESDTEGTSTGSSSSKTYGMPGQYSSQEGSQKSHTTSEQNSDQTTEQTSESKADQKSTQKSTAKNESGTETWTATINKKRMEKDALLASQFITLPVTSPRNGLHGYYLLPSVGAFYGVLEAAEVKGSLLPPDPREPNYLPRPVAEQYLRPWAEEELSHLGLTGAATEKGGSEKEGASSEEGSADEGRAINPFRTAEPSLPVATEERLGRAMRGIARWLPDTDTEQGLTRF